MENTEKNLNIWITEDEASDLLGIKPETLRKSCSLGKYIFKISKRKNKHVYKVLLSSLPVEIQDKYSNRNNDLASGLMEYNQAPDWIRKQADKYILILRSCECFKGQELKDFIDNWNIQNPELKTSYSSVMYFRKEYELKGIAGLLAKPSGNTGKTKLQKEWVEYFKQLYLIEGAPTAESCHRIVKGCFGSNNNDFPSVRTFLRQLQREVPKQSM